MGKPFADLSDLSDCSKVARRPRRPVRPVTLAAPRGFTLIEILIVVAILAVIAGLLLPVFWNARQKAHQATCLSNLRQLNAALIMYAQDNNGVFPPSTGGTASLPQIMSAYIKGEPGQTVFRCPACVVPAEQLKYGAGPWGYAINSNIIYKEWAREGDARAEILGVLEKRSAQARAADRFDTP